MKRAIRVIPVILLVLLFLAAAPRGSAEDTLRFPNGVEVAADAERVDLSTLTHRDAAEAAALLGQMSALRHVDLGADRAVTRLEQDGTPLPEPTIVGAIYSALQELPAEETESERLSWEDIRLLVEAAPGAEVEYRFHISNLQFSTLSRKMDINHIRFDDEGALIRQILPCMQKLTYLDMDFCGVSSESMAAIRDAYPEVEVIWRVWFGPQDRMSVRTDVERILASSYGINDSNSGELRWCTRVKYLDLGHSEMQHIRFIRYMPELEVCIIAINELTDISELAYCPKLEYLELFHNYILRDLSPLAGLENLRHLNISNCWEMDDISAVYDLELERFYIGAKTKVPAEQIAEYRRRHPDCEVEDTLWEGSESTWRYSPDPNTRFVPRYALLRDQIDYDHFGGVVALYYNDPKYAGPNR